MLVWCLHACPAVAIITSCRAVLVLVAGLLAAVSRAMPARPSGVALIEHLRAQAAPRAAARLYAASASLRREVRAHDSALGARLERELELDWPASTATSGPTAQFRVDPARVHLVNDDASVRALGRAVQELGRDADVEAPAVALDAEWRPDSLHSGGSGVGSSGQQNSPSLLQLALPADVWLIDLQQLVRPSAPGDAGAAQTDIERLLDEALCGVLPSEGVRVLGFSFQTDLDRLHAAYGRRMRCFRAARDVVDIRDACAAALGGGAGGGAGTSGSLAAQLERWCGYTLDKSEQCSDWAARPLRPAQIEYAAADAACLRALASALVAGAGAQSVRACERAFRPSAEAMAAAEAGQASPVERGTAALALAPAADAEAGAQQLGPSALRAVLAAAEQVAAAAPQPAQPGAGSARDSDSAGVLEGPPVCGVYPVELVRDAIRAGRGLPADAARVSSAEAPTAAASRESTPRPASAGAPPADCTAAAPGHVRWREVNALCLLVARRKPEEATEDAVLVLTPANARLDLRWLACVLGVPRRAVRLARAAECAPLFDAEGAGAAAPASAGAGDSADVSGESGAAGAEAALVHHARPFAWLPDPRIAALRLDEAICGSREHYARGGRSRPRAGAPRPEYGTAEAGAARSGADGGPPPPELAIRPLRMTLEPSLAALARKLRLVGVDAAVAGEVVRADTAADGSAWRGLERVRVEVSGVEAAFRRAAVRGRVRVHARTRVAEGLPGPAYRLLATDPEAQFAELLAVFGLSHAVHGGESRCGICNGDRWRRLSPREARGRVPDGVLAENDDFFQCGVCSQIFWPGPKYTSTMDTLKAAVGRGGASAATAGQRTTTSSSGSG